MHHNSFYILYVEVPEASENLPAGCSLQIPEPDALHEIVLRVSPTTGYWRDGTFEFYITVPLEYNISVRIYQ